jgi:hypothetical protein
MSKYLIPSCDELSSIFGCDCWIDENHIQIMKFADEDKSDLSIYIGHVDDSVKIVFNKDLTTVIDIYMENLEEFFLDVDKQIIKMVFNQSYKVTVEIKLWSKFLIKINSMVF